MASFDMLQALQDHPEWIAPRSDIRVFLAQPGGSEAVKTTVEPGNVFSPGMRTFGVTWWLRFPESGVFFATETTPLELLRWSYQDGYLPVMQCDVEIDGIAARHTLFQDGQEENQSEAVAARLELKNIRGETIKVEVFIALRSLGPAGGPIINLSVGSDGLSLVSNGDVLIAADLLPQRAGCGIGDPSSLAQKGLVPGAACASDPKGWCFGLLWYEVDLKVGESWIINLDCPIHSRGVLTKELPVTVVPRPGAFTERMAQHLSNWRRQFGEIDLKTPDIDFRNAFFAGLQHMLTAMVGDQVRIAAMAYPLPWLRDSVFIIRCLDLAGQNKAARAASDYVARNDFFGGFGAEGDAPGLGIWALVQHYRITKDRDWLASVYPAVRRKVEWIFRMRRTQSPIRVMTDTPVLPFLFTMRNLGVICLAAQDGVIQGVMDHGVNYSLGWVNHWSICGLREAALAAKILGYENDEKAWKQEAQELLAAMRRLLQNDRSFLAHERTCNSLLWPTRAWEEDPDLIRAPFLDWFYEHRGDGVNYQPEPYWLYFEFAQAHNALLLGRRDLCWQTVNYRLRHPDAPGLFAYREGGDGVGTENAIHGVSILSMLRGCHKYNSIMPHGWSQAELWLLQRAMLIEEWADGLILFAGVPPHWLVPDSTIEFTNFPTWYGTISAKLVVSGDGQSARIIIEGVDHAIPVSVLLPGRPPVAWIAQSNYEMVNVDLV